MKANRRLYKLSRLPPSTNNHYFNVPGHGRFRTKKSNAWIQDAGWELIEQGRVKIDGSFGVSLRVNPAKTKADLDNLIKPVVDLLVALFFVDDDRHLCEIEAAWDHGVDVAEVTIWASDLDRHRPS